MKIIYILWVFCVSVSAQTLDINALRASNKATSVFPINQSAINRETQSINTHLMDTPIDKNQYLIGPGDQFQVNIISSSEVSTFKLVVSPSGEILIPSVGVIQVFNLSLNEAITAMTAAIHNWNQTANIHITLSQIREFKIKVIGHLRKPGLYTATPVSRVSDIYEIIMDKHLEKIELKDESKSVQEDSGEMEYLDLSHRNIKIVRNGDSLKIDLVKFGSTGEDKHNPFIHQGDILIIPVKQHMINIFGGIKIPGEYEYVDDESLYEFIKLAGGLRPDADPTKIEITRFKTFSEKYTFFIEYKNSKTIKIEPEDHIMVRYEKDYKRQDIVYITGEIHFPGVYAIEEGATLNNVLNRAGGFTNKADPTKIRINNKSIEVIPDRERIRILLIPEENRSPSERAYIKARALTKRGSIESNSRTQMETLLNFILVNNDNIFIPEDYKYIEVLGGVVKPGRYPFYDGKLVNDYILLAGGKTKTSTRNTFIIKAGTGQRLPAKKDVNLENGDTIFIADKMEYNKWIILKDTLATLGQVAALIVVIQNAIGQ
ncbi:MAG: hypothetical protein CMG57_01370 [Candidatus Marinimicrobia bacterium]|nr:hypothetical protein [Candidatus Neomarinimicrobiota bacterium]